MAILCQTRINKSNLGDVLINTLLIRELSKSSIVYLDGKPDKTFESLINSFNPYKSNIAYYNSSSIFDGKPVFRWLRLLKKIPLISVVFDPPGHYFDDGSFKDSLKTIKYIGRAFFLKRLGIKMLRLGVTIGPFSNTGWTAQKKLAEVYAGLGIRDKSNYENLIRKGLKNLFLVDDISLLYNVQDFIAEKSCQRQRYGNYAIISFRGATKGRIVDNNYLNSIIESFIRIIKANVVGTNTTLLFTYQVKEDFLVIKKMLSNIAHLNVKYILVESQLDLKDAINLYNGAEYVLTNRLHVGLLALLNNSPAYIITRLEEHHKLVNVYKDLGLYELLIDSCHKGTVILKTREELKSTFNNFNTLKNQKRAELQKKIADIAS